jgi:hypothetical protein
VPDVHSGLRSRLELVGTSLARGSGADEKNNREYILSILVHLHQRRCSKVVNAID